MNSVVGLIMISLVGLDQLTKMWATAALSGGKDIAVWTNVFHLHYVKNTGAAFGILGGKQILLIVITGTITIVMLFYLRKLPQTFWGKWAKFSFILIISGAIGNLIDRIFLNYVRDFLYFKLIDFPVFNIADICVVVGVGILLVVMLLGDIEEEKEKRLN